jgi:hypothetical protein
MEWSTCEVTCEYDMLKDELETLKTRVRDYIALVEEPDSLATRMGSARKRIAVWAELKELVK